MNFTIFEKSNLGYHFTSKDVLIDDEWIKSGLILSVIDIRVKFWRHNYDLPTYRVDIEFMLFGGECKSVTLYHEIKNEQDLQDYFNNILKKIKNEA